MLGRLLYATRWLNRAGRLEWAVAIPVILVLALACWLVLLGTLRLALWMVLT
jgi:hypothetical protein